MTAKPARLGPVSTTVRKVKEMDLSVESMAQKNANTAHRLKAVAEATKAWERAPVHVKAMAGAYVGPLLDAIYWIDHDLGILKEEARKQREALEVLIVGVAAMQPGDDEGTRL